MKLQLLKVSLIFVFKLFCRMVVCVLFFIFNVILEIDGDLYSAMKLPGLNPTRDAFSDFSRPVRYVS